MSGYKHRSNFLPYVWIHCSWKRGYLQLNARSKLFLLSTNNIKINLHWPDTALQVRSDWSRAHIPLDVIGDGSFNCSVLYMWELRPHGVIYYSLRENDLRGDQVKCQDDFFYLFNNQEVRNKGNLSEDPAQWWNHIYISLIMSRPCKYIGLYSHTALYL